MQGANDIFGLAEHGTGLGLAENRFSESMARWGWDPERMGRMGRMGMAEALPILQLGCL